MTTKLKLLGFYVIESFTELAKCRPFKIPQFSSFMLQNLQVGAAVQITKQDCSCYIDFPPTFCSCCIRKNGNAYRAGRESFRNL